jgi:ubiquinone/menaquinone biosynthesis C-methylase UbiE
MARGKDDHHDHHAHGHHHHERSQEYEWEEDAANYFLKIARQDAKERYPPIAVKVARLSKGSGVEPIILDLGCGPALLLPELARVLPRARLIGMDPSKDMLRLAKRVLSEAPSGNYELMEGRAEEIPLDDGHCDVVVSLKNLHEWEEAGKGMAEVSRVLRPGGVLVLQDVNRGYPKWKLRLLVAWLRITKGRMATHAVLMPYRDAYRPEQVDALLSEAGFQEYESDTGSIELSYVARRP